jgi:pyruvate dehydrogenase E1 component
MPEDLDPRETQEWLEALDSVVEFDGADRAAFLLDQLHDEAQVGQLYRPEDANQLMYYKEDKSGQMLQEGIDEPGAMSSWMAAATSYSVSDTPMIPFYVYYSMFGFQRVGDLAWAAGDSRARGFLLGGTAGRTTLNGEGLQHEDGHSHLIAATIPNCVSYDPTYGHEVAVIVQDGLRRMFTEQEDVYYYLTVMNENYVHPGLPGLDEDADRRDEAIEGIKRGMYLLRSTDSGSTGSGSTGDETGPRVQLMGSGTILREVEAGAELLASDFGVAADIWSCPSFTELGRDTMATERWNLLHPSTKEGGETPRTAWVTERLSERPAGPVVAATDYMRAFAEQIRPSVPADRRYVVLGTDGFGRSDYRVALRRHFEVDRHYVVLAALSALAADGSVPESAPGDAISRYDIDVNKVDPARA